MIDSIQRTRFHSHDRSRHGRPTRHGYLEPVQWLLSSAGRGWRWVWSVDHDDAASTAVAWLLQFVLVASLLFVTAVSAS